MLKQLHSASWLGFYPPPICYMYQPIKKPSLPTKGVITWRILAWAEIFQPAPRAEILLPLHGEFQPGFKHNFSITAILFRWIFRQCACSNSRPTQAEILLRLQEGFQPSSPGWTYSAWAKNPSLVSKSGLEFSAWAEIQPGQKPSPYNRHFHFKRISFRTTAEISAQPHRAEIHHVITA